MAAYIPPPTRDGFGSNSKARNAAANKLAAAAAKFPTTLDPDFPYTVAPFPINFLTKPMTPATKVTPTS